MKALRRVKAGKPAKKKVSKKMKKAIKKAIKKGGSTSSKTSSKAVKKAAKAAGVDHVAMAKRTVRLANEVYSRAQKMCKFDKKEGSKKQAKKEMKKAVKKGKVNLKKLEKSGAVSKKQ